MSDKLTSENDSFTITLVSSASMKIFNDNSLGSFRNLLSENFYLQSEWRVALTEITFLTQINNVTDAKLLYYKKDEVKTSLKVAKDKISRTYDGVKKLNNKG